MTLAFGLELDPIYVDVAVRRWQKFTGGIAIHSGTGLTFEKTTAERSSNGLLPPLSAFDGKPEEGSDV